MNILWLDASIPAATMSSWVVREGKKSVFWVTASRNPSSQVLTPKYLRQYDQALIELSRIDVLVNSATELTLSATFKASLRQAITGGYARAGKRLELI
jgi:transcription initiation factor TFIIH subunit 4